MELLLQRRPSEDETTIGDLSIDGAPECFTLEDEVREVPGRPVSEWKVAGKTAIPAGRYRVVVTLSQRFGRMLPLLENVPGFTGIRIHPGNSNSDTEGCLLTGTDVGGDGKTIIASRAAFGVLFQKIKDAIAADEAVWIEVVNAGVPAEAAA